MPLHIQLLLALLTFCGLVVLAVYLPWRKKCALWRVIAQRHGLKISIWALDGSISLEGPFEGRSLYLTTLYRGSMMTRADMGVIALSMSEVLPQAFFLRPASLGDKLAGLVGHGDVEVGDAEFDAAFTLTNLDPGTAELLRDPEVRRECLKLARDFPGDFWLQRGALTLQRKLFQREEEFESFLRPGLELCRVLEAAARRHKVASAS